MPAELLHCVECDTDQPFSEFGSARRSGTRSTRCATCRAGRPRHTEPDRQAWMRRYQWARNLKLKYGMTVEDYDRLYEAQGGVCLICLKPETRTHYKTGIVQPLAVDHDHATGRVRGLLCSRCNQMLGLLDDDPEILRRMARYIELRPSYYEVTVTVPAALTRPHPMR